MLPLLLSLYLINTIKAVQNSCDNSCYKCLEQSDFDEGTYRIQQSNSNQKYCLGEDIVFNPLFPIPTQQPNTPFDSCFPINDNTFPGCNALSNGPYALGFFAAITIETDDVELDLNGHEISMGKRFYIQQRTFTIIEIGKAPFITGQGPTNFGQNDGIIQNTYIHDGVLGLSSHSGLHSNSAQNTTIENLRICEFETAGVQFNGFNKLKMNNLIIGPSSTQVKPCGYYANAKFLSLAFKKLIDALEAQLPTTQPPEPVITFSGGRSKNIKEIYEDLIESLDIAYRYFNDESTDNDKDSDLYDISIDLYSNPMEIPDGSSISGIVLNSKGIGINAFVDSGELDGENVQMSNIKISDLKLNVNEIPAASFDQCVDPFTNGTQVIKGPFGDVMDLRRMVGEFRNGQVIDLGDDYTQLCYVGNPLSDAQIALGLYGEDYGLEYGIQGQNDEFLKWALEEHEGESYDTLPSCTAFTCNGDIMFHENKGVIGLRMDNIEDVRIENIMVKRLMNKSPLASYACDNYYSGKHDGGTPSNREREGSLGSDVRGISITSGEVIFDGYNNVIQKLVSYNGNVVGLDIRDDGNVEFDYVYKDELPSKDDEDTEDDKSSIQIKQLAPGHEITFALLAELMVDKKYPYPNYFEACNIKIQNKDAGGEITPYPPNGIDKVWCADYVPDDPDAIIGSVLPVDVDVDAEASDSNDVVVSANVQANVNNIPGNELKKGTPNNGKLLDLLTKDKDKDTNIINKYPNTPYIYFIVGLICIIMVVFVLVTFIMKCGKIMMAQDRKYNRGYGKASFEDSDSDSDITDDEENQPI